MDDEVRWLLLGGLALVLLLIVIQSPVGSLIGDIIALVPGAIWGWIFGIAALIGLVIIGKAFLSQ